MESSKKILLTTIGIAVLIVFLSGVTFAFFNYTRTGTSNVIKVGRITFDSSQNGSINLTNAFPITSTQAETDTTNTDDVVINITGDTTYSDGIEYLLTATAVENTKNNKTVPISIITSAINLGTNDEEYYEHRGGATAVYKVLAKETISNNDQLLVGYIPSGVSGVNGSVTIRAFIDRNLVSISDTYNGTDTVTDNMGTTSTWVNGRTNFTTSEWNDINISFKIKVEANEGTWVEEIRSVNAMNTFPKAITNQSVNIKEVYFNKMGATRMQNAYNNATIKADLTYNNEGKVLAWLETNTDDNTKYNLIVASDGDTYLITGNYLFSGWTFNVNKFVFNNVNTSRVLTMNNMFSSISGGVVLDLDLRSFDTSNVTDMTAMFNGSSGIRTIDLSSFDTRSVSTAPAMFMNNSSLEKIYVSNLWNISGASDSAVMFNNCTSLVGQAPNGTTYAFTDYNTADKTYAVIATNDTVGYLTDISLKPTA